MLFVFASLLLSCSLVIGSPLAPNHRVEYRASLARVYSSCTEPNTVALTFDDGPYKYESTLVDELDNAGVKATFFVNGNNYDCIYEESVVSSLQKAYNSGHQIGSHTWAHLDLTAQSSSKIDSEMSKVEFAMKRILGVTPAFMRPPYGAYNDQVRQVAAQHGQSVIIWDFDSGDSVGASTSDSKQTYDSAISQNPSNLLALNHEVYPGTVNTVIPYAIKQIREKLPNHRFVTVAECVGASSPYLTVGKPSARSSSWKC